MPLTQFAEDKIAPKQHTIVIKQWNLPKNKDDSSFLGEYDGRLLQPNSTWTISDLHNLKFEFGSILKVVLPPGPIPGDNFLKKMFFLHHAIDDGASLVFYQDGKKLNCHTLLFQSLRLGPFSEEKKWTEGWNTDTATYLLDGKKYFDGPSVATELKKLPQKDLVIMVLFPTGDDGYDRNRDVTDKSEIDHCVESLKENMVKFVPVGGVGYSAWPVPIFPDR